MKVKSNVPKDPVIEIQEVDENWSLNDYLFSIGDEVRIQEKSPYGEYPYAGQGYIGEIREITPTAMRIITAVSGWDHQIFFEDIFLMRHRRGRETFETDPYYDEEERKFWSDHWMTKDGIRKKTPENKAMLKKFRNNH